MIRDALLAAGVALSFASQISVPGLPLGYGEFFLAIWIMLSIGRILAGGRIEVTAASLQLAGFWLLLSLTLAIGTVVGYFTTVLYLTGLSHDAMAYGLLASFTCLAVLEPNAEFHLRRSAWWMVAIAVCAFAIQVGLAFGGIHQPGVDPWYWDRFRGWSENPNQLALYCAVFGPLALHLAATSRNRWAQFLALSSLIPIIYVGRLSKSDTYLYTTILSGLVFLGLRSRAWFASNGNRPSLARQIALLLMVGAAPLALAAAPYAVTEESSVASFAKSLTKDGGGEATAETFELRVFLWNEAIEKGLQSGSLGLGPGPHLERPPVADRQFLERPFEAHNTILDLYLQGGLLAVLALVWIVGSAAMSAWRSRFDALSVLLASVVVFSMPHLIIRHPIVWFALTFCLVAGMRQELRHGLQHARIA
ncbi:O-antigen ligase family protein [Mesorhizobium sp.]|uniref:O-antigen ligase family protein n=1 Tax=Mesorhizobium sp. TaxID=1871066 RepID=UPI000FE4885A|nr:O-antigen ligase family protein [Mesorhizobium sp.]RWB67635.1 MAG: polymerase [Mesorhizobium sp.]RWB84028.1 MAG: polymerase [Mesorhizobium sp.]